MPGTIELEKLAVFIRLTRPEVFINESHKLRLRRELLTATAQRSSLSYQWVLAGVVGMAAVGILVMVLMRQKPVVGMAEWNPSLGNPISIHAGQVYDTGNSTLVITFPENTRMQISPHSVFSVLSNSTDRQRENTVVFLEQGELLVYVFVHKEFPVLVRTPDVEVKVTGTKFRVRVTQLKSN